MAALFGDLPPLAVAQAKRAMHAGRDRPLAEGLAAEAEAFAAAFETADRGEGLAAFLEKRPARFEGR